MLAPTRNRHVRQHETLTFGHNIICMNWMYPGHLTTSQIIICSVPTRHLGPWIPSSMNGLLVVYWYCWYGKSPNIRGTKRTPGRELYKDPRCFFQICTLSTRITRIAGVGYLEYMEWYPAEDDHFPCRACISISTKLWLAGRALVSLILVTDFLDTPGAKPDMKIYMDVLDVKNNGFNCLSSEIHPHMDPFGISDFESHQNLRTQIFMTSPTWETPTVPCSCSLGSNH